MKEKIIKEKHIKTSIEGEHYIRIPIPHPYFLLKMLYLDIKVTFDMLHMYIYYIDE